MPNVVKFVETKGKRNFNFIFMVYSHRNTGTVKLLKRK